MMGNYLNSRRKKMFIFMPRLWRFEDHNPFTVPSYGKKVYNRTAKKEIIWIGKDFANYSRNAD
jgi:hypothetical protein